MNIHSIKATSPGKASFSPENNPALDMLEANEILIENMISHVSLGTEMACIAGREDWFSFPGTLGYTSIGRVVEKANGIAQLSIGDIVYTFGPHSSHFKINITDRWHGICEPVSKNISLQKAAFTHMAGIAITALRKSSIVLGDWVAVAGMGAIGNLCAQLCQLQGANVIGIDISDSRLKIANECGICHTVNSANEDLEAFINGITKGQKVSTFIDATGVPAVIMQATKLLSLYGKLILLGSPRSVYQTNLTEFLQPIHLWNHGSIEVIGALEFTLPTHRSEFNSYSIAQNAAIILQLLEDDKLTINPLISKIVSPKEAEDVYLTLQQEPEAYLGVLFDWNTLA